ncbi:MAG TPA: metallophosphoesterase [Chitinophagales bacterium]|nr:metallophosphoesterase [Chitinophagales bacterium]
MGIFTNYFMGGWCLIVPFFLQAQSTPMPEYNLNKNIPGAQYKFSFVHISDIHIGEGFSDYGTPGYFNDTMPANDESKPAKALRQAVKWINARKDDKNIKFVVVSGDLTGSAEKSEFKMSKLILDGLEIPYVPIIGNHDIWPYTRYQDEAPYACGDSVMNEVFSEVYEKNKLFFQNWNDGTRLIRTYNPESKREHYLQNFSFEYDGFVFYGLDFNPRYHVNKAEPGIGPEARLMDWQGGTFRWLKNELANQPNKKNHNICFISHHPATDNLLFILSGFVFSGEDYLKMVNMLEPYRQNLGLWMAGHIHIDYDYPLVNNIMQVRGIAANKEYDSSYFEIVNVYEVPDLSTAIHTPISTKKEMTVFPNPNHGKFTVADELFDGNAVLRIYNSFGIMLVDKQMKEFSAGNGFYQFDFSYLPKGSYIISVTDNQQTNAQQFFIQ